MGRTFHAQFHALVDASRCSGTALECADRVWTPGATSGIDPRELLKPWAAEFTTAFDREHEWPLEVQAAMLLRREFTATMTIESLARTVASSRAVLAAVQGAVCDINRIVRPRSEGG